MRTISFDLDGTLLCGRLGSLADPDLPALPDTVRDDRLRRGAVPLLRELANDGHGIWIYTESLRGRTLILAWSAALGIPISGMVNRQIHESEWVRRKSPLCCPRKYPPWFGIELHVDNDPGIAAEGAALGYRVILIDPTAEDFARAVRNKLFHPRENVARQGTTPPRLQ